MLVYLALAFVILPLCKLQSTCKCMFIRKYCHICEIPCLKRINYPKELEAKLFFGYVIAFSNELYINLLLTALIST
jgi:hypothetical protein